MEKVNSAAPSSFGLASYLETQLGEKVSTETRRGAALSDWSSTLPLPEDMASFYKESDGFDLSWAQGSVSLRRLRDVKEVPIDDDFPGAAALCVQVTFTVVVMPPKNIRIFLSLQSQVCLVYKSRDDSTPTVWFQDLACRWHFLATCLTRYFRLQVVHLGIRGWHYAYTDIGLDPVARQFLAFYCPERLYAEDNHLVLAPRAFANRKATSVLSPCNNSKLSIR